MLQVSGFCLFGTDPAFLPLGVAVDKFGKLGIGNGIFIQFERFDFNQTGIFFQIKRAVAAAFDLNHFGSCRIGTDECRTEKK
ncbi:Uncharacterised protein [Neisseria meningitidis]|nr:Uncharacterised protein [Neisseria meningitidis]